MKIIKKTHIPSGSYKTGSKSPEMFQAFLGTCVGVAIYDRLADVGGMLHILLPEPPSAMEPEYPEKYASTALPMMLKELYQMGAIKENMTATIAGGALVGPLNQQDINLDIGGRSTEIAMAFLEKESIKVIKSETGGFFTCTLELNLHDGQTTIQPSWEEKEISNIKFDTISKEDIAITIETLQPIPQAALKILRLVQERRHDINKITRELATDQVLCARTLQICNSAMFAGRIKIETLNDAVLLLGESLLVQSVITAAVKRYFEQTGSVSGYSLVKGGIFFHAVGTGMAAEKIAGITEKSDPKNAYTAGLLHDIGKVVLDQFIAKVCPLFFRGVHKNGSSSLSLEKKLLGTTHCHIGAYLAQQWNLPDSLSQVILYHHNPEQAKGDRDLVRIIYLADLIMSRFNTGLELEKIKTGNLEITLEKLGLTLTDFSGLIDSIPLNTFDAQNQA